MSAAPEPLLELAGARLGYGRASVLAEVDLALHREDYLLVLGPNGAGKTTLLRGLLGIDPLLSGERRARGRLGYVPQRGALDPIYPLRARQIVAMGLLGEARQPRAVQRARVEAALEACGIAAAGETLFRELSGGQSQRVLIARALVSDPDLLVLDEPSNNLDPRGQVEVAALLDQLHAAGRALVLVSHRWSEAGNRVALVSGGRVEVGPPELLLSAERLGAAFGWPEGGERLARLRGAGA